MNSASKSYLMVAILSLSAVGFGLAGVQTAEAQAGLIDDTECDSDPTFGLLDEDCEEYIGNQCDMDEIPVPTPGSGFDCQGVPDDCPTGTSGNYPNCTGGLVPPSPNTGALVDASDDVGRLACATYNEEVYDEFSGTPPSDTTIYCNGDETSGEAMEDFNENMGAFLDPLLCWLSGITPVVGQTLLGEYCEPVNVAPVFDPVLPEEFTEIEGALISFRVNATDADGDVLMFTNDTNATGAQILENGTGGYDFSWDTSGVAAGQYYAYFTVSDGKDFTDGNVTITINEPAPNTAPRFDSYTISDVEVEDGSSKVVFDFSANDAEGDELTFALDPATNISVSSYTLEQSGNTAWINWTEDGDIGDYYWVNVTVEDAEFTDHDNFTIRIIAPPPNTDPVFDPVLPEEFTEIEGALISFRVNATDADGDVLMFTNDTNATGAQILENGTGGYDFSWDTSGVAAGQYYAYFTVSDGKDFTDGNVTITINEPVTSLENNVTMGQAPLTVMFWANATDTSKVVSDPSDPSKNATFDDGQGNVLVEGTDFDVNAPIIVEYSTRGTYHAWFNGTYSFGGTFNHNKGPIVVGGLPEFVEEIPAEVYVDEGDSVFIRVNATDPDGDELTYSEVQTNITTGAYTYDANATDSDWGKDFAWSVPTDGVGWYYAHFTVDDGAGGNIEKNVTITVARVNDEPVLDSIGDQSVLVRDTLRFPVVGSDADRDHLEYFIGETNLTGAESLFTQNETSGGWNFTWTPTQDSVGSYYIEFIVSEVETGIADSENITITVGLTNNNPVITPIGDQFVEERATLNFAVVASDMDGDGLSYAIDASGTNLTGAESLFTQNETSGGWNFTWTPTKDDVGWYLVEFNITDIYGGWDNETVKITVTADVTAPGAVKNLVVVRNDTHKSTQLKVTWDAPMNVDIDHFNVYYHTTPFNVAHGTANMQPTMDGATTSLILRDLDPGTLYHVNVTAVDDSSMANEGLAVGTGKSVATQVNYAPVLDAIDTTITIEVNHTLRIPVKANDDNPDDTLEYAIAATNLTEAVATYEFKDNATGYGKNFTWTPTDADIDEYYIEFDVTDNHGGHDGVNVTIRVIPDLVKPGPVHGLGVENTESKNHTQLNVSWTAPEDTDIDHFKVYYDTNPFNVTNTSIAFENTLDGTAGHLVLTKLNPETTYYVNVTAIDVAGNEGEPFETSVKSLQTAVNNPAVIVDVGDRFVREGEWLNVSFYATDDVDGDDLTYPLNIDTNITHGEFDYVHNGTGDGMNFSWQPGPAANGTYFVNFTVHDDYIGGEAWENVTIVVEREDDPPVLMVPALSMSVDQGDTLAFKVSASDADGDDLTLADLDATHTDIVGFSYDVNTTTIEADRDFSWTPTPSDAGLHFANFTVSTAEEGEVFVNVTIMVYVNQAPALAREILLDQSVKEGDELFIHVNGTDADGDSLSYTTLTNATGSTFGPNLTAGGYDFAWTPGPADNGTFYAEFIIDDNNGTTLSRNVTIAVTRVNDAPILDAVGDKSIGAEDTLTFVLTASDLDEDTVWFIVNSNATAIEENLDSNGTFSWTPTNSDVGTYYANFSAIDGFGGMDWENVTFTVIPLNRPPILDAIGPRFVEEADTLDLRVNGSDADLDDLTFDSLDAAHTNIPLSQISYTENDTLGGMDFSWSPAHADIGWYWVNFTVTDPNGLLDYENVTVTVRPSIAPVLGSIGNLQIEKGDDYSKTLGATDPGDEAGLVFALKTNSTSASLDQTTHKFTWDGDDLGWSWANFTVTDDDGLFDYENVTLTVVPYTPPQNQQTDSGGGGGGGGSRAATDDERQSLDDAGLEAFSSGDIQFIDEDKDGDIDSIKTVSGRIEAAQNVDSLDILVLVDTETGKMAVMDFKTGVASPVKGISAEDITVKAQGKTDDEKRVAVTVPKEQGWIHVAIKDPAAGQNITSLTRSDGVVLKLDQAWRTSDGKLHFIDDPETTYTFGFEPVPKDSRVGLWITLSILGVLLLAGGIYGGIYLYRHPEVLDRFRRQPDTMEEEVRADMDQSFSDPETNQSPGTS